MLKFTYKSKEELFNNFTDFWIFFAYHSGKIENDEITYHDTRDIFEDGRVREYTGDLKTLFEIQNQKKCYGYIVEKLA